MDDIRWFAPNRFCTLPVPALRRAGMRIALNGDAPAQLAVASDSTVVRAAFAYARRHHCRLLVYLWDLPPWEVGQGRPDHVFAIGSRVVKLARLWGRYPERPGFHSRNQFVAQRAAAVWCPSQDAQQALQMRFGIAAERVPFCYDSERFDLAAGWSRSPADGRPLLLSISRLVDYKNHVAVLRAAARLSPRPMVHVIGRGPEAANIRALAARLGVELRLDEGWLTDDAMVAAYRAANVVVCPSRFEGFGLTPMEAIAMGVPVVASDIPPHREFVGAHARFFALDDDGALVRMVEAALAHDAMHALPADRSAPLPDLTIEACAGRFLPRLEQLLGRRGRAD